MKLATMRDGSRDGQLVVVSRDLARAHYVGGIAHTLQQALEDWNFIAPQLQDLSDELNAGRARHAFALDAAQCFAPLPRSFSWVHGCPWPTHRERCAPQDVGDWQQAAGAGFLPPQASWGALGEQPYDFSAGLAAITGDVAAGCAAEQAAEGVRLLSLVLSLVQGQTRQTLATVFAPVAVTPDELTDAWQGARAHLAVQVQLNGRKFGLCDAAADMAQDFGACIAACAQPQSLTAGSIVGCLPVSNADAARGFCSLLERRCVEAAQDGEPQTPWLCAGDVLQVHARRAAGGGSVFGDIHLQLSAAQAS